MAEPLIEVTRGPVAESTHWGSVAVVDRTGKLLYSAGDPHRLTYLRSAAKPLQALNAFLCGAVDRYGLDEGQIAVLCASHYGQPFHRQAVEGILEKIALKPSDMLCGSPLSISGRIAREQLWNHEKLDPLGSDCSGKHAGFLAACCLKGYPLDNYDKIENPVQQDVLRVLAYMLGMEPGHILVAEDGCGVPAHAAPLSRLAYAYARLADPTGLSQACRSACQRVFEAMSRHPAMVAGTGAFCTELMRHTGGKLVGKIGDEGIYCVGVREKGIGIALKIEDGESERACPPAILRALCDLQLLDEDELAALDQFIAPAHMNDHGRQVGEIRAVYHLRPAEGLGG